MAGMKDSAIMSRANPPRMLKRARAARAAMDARWAALYGIVVASRPMTVRQVFYQAAVFAIVERTERGYGQIQYDLANMRRAAVLPHDWIATRWERKPLSFYGIDAAPIHAAEPYSRDPSRHTDSLVEIWLEEDALAAVLYPVCAEYGVPLRVLSYGLSPTFLNDAAKNIAALRKPTYIYHLGDFDTSGVDASFLFEARLRRMAPQAEIHFEHLAVLPEQIQAWRLPGRPTRTSDRRAKRLGDISVELEAIEPTRLREIVQAAIERHLPAEQLRVLKVAEDSEREGHMALVEQFQGKGHTGYQS